MCTALRSILAAVCLASTLSIAQEASGSAEELARLKRELQETRSGLADSRREIEELRQGLQELRDQLQANPAQ